jgi:hypothetical protein
MCCGRHLLKYEVMTSHIRVLHHDVPFGRSWFPTRTRLDPPTVHVKECDACSTFRRLNSQALSSLLLIRNARGLVTEHPRTMTLTGSAESAAKVPTCVHDARASARCLVGRACCKGSDTVCMTQEQLPSVSRNKRLAFLSTHSPSSAHQQLSSAFKPTNSSSPTKQHVLQGFRCYPCPRRRRLRPPEPERRLDHGGASVLPERHERERP